MGFQELLGGRFELRAELAIGLYGYSDKRDFVPLKNRARVHIVLIELGAYDDIAHSYVSGDTSRYSGKKQSIDFVIRDQMSGGRRRSDFSPVREGQNGVRSPEFSFVIGPHSRGGGSSLFQLRHEEIDLFVHCAHDADSHALSLIRVCLGSELLLTIFPHSDLVSGRRTRYDRGMVRSLFAASILLIFFHALPAHAWGERGHHLICAVATRLVKDPGLREFMEARADMMGHLCNIPDIYWKSLPSSEVVNGSSAHYLDPEAAGFSVSQVPLSIEQYFAHSLKKYPTAVETADKLGTLWWRADQIWKRAVASAKTIPSTTPPATPADEQNWKLPYNEAVYGFILNAGLLGHFPGDASMPFHGTIDYDGWETGRGGIHHFYEETCVDWYGSDLNAEVDHKARTVKRAPAGSSIVEIMKKLSVQASADKPKVEALDQVIKPSNQEKKIRAERKPLKIACPKFHSLIVYEMARSASALADLWDRAYREAGSPDLSRYRSYHYPLQPDFIPVDYLPSR